MSKFSGKPNLPPAPSSQWPFLGWSPADATKRVASKANPSAVRPLGFSMPKGNPRRFSGA